MPFIELFEADRLSSTDHGVLPGDTEIHYDYGVFGAPGRPQQSRTQRFVESKFWPQRLAIRSTAASNYMPIVLR